MTEAFEDRRKRGSCCTSLTQLADNSHPLETNSGIVPMARLETAHINGDHKYQVALRVT